LISRDLLQETYSDTTRLLAIGGCYGGCWKGLGHALDCRELVVRR